jgi:hypothetical protein
MFSGDFQAVLYLLVVIPSLATSHWPGVNRHLAGCRKKEKSTELLPT